MSHTETRREVEEWEWEVEVCDNCGHDKSDHYPENGYTQELIELKGNPWTWEWVGCCMIDRDPKTGGRILKTRYPGLDKDNPFPRCKCMKFV